MSKTIKLHRGLDLKLKGALAADAPTVSIEASAIALVPDDFPGFIPKLDVREGDEVALGQPLMHDKVNEEVKLVSPVAGRVKAVVRGERRKILRVEIEATKNSAAPVTFSLKVSDQPDKLRQTLMQSGLWAMMRQRPYDIVPSPAAVPVNVFVTGFDSAPLAPDMTLCVKGHEAELKAGIEVLAKLTSGNVYLSTRPDCGFEVPAPAHHIIIEGPHPAGNPGVQAANIAPVNKGETIWTLDLPTVIRIGTLATKGIADWTTLVAVTGSEVEQPRLVKTVIGAAIAPLLKGDLKDSGHHRRIIAGNVLTGARESLEGYLRYPYTQITVIPEGDDKDEFMGWASMSPDKLSASRSFLSRLLPGRKFAPDARINGGHRAMIMSEQYDRVIPMDILPEYLIKAILARDIEQMEQLGIYEVAPEDFALAEFVDPSKLELQKIVRQGLDYVRKELE